MHHWKQICGAMATVVVIAALTAIPGSASAQQAAPAPKVAAPAAASAPVVQRPVFKARDLITMEERQAYRQEIRAARNDMARQQQIREKMRATLRQRAAARGGVLAEMGRPTPVQQKEAVRPEAPASRPAPLPPRAP